MDKLCVIEDKFYYITNDGKKELLLDMGDYLSNKSHIPLHSLENVDYDLIPNLMIKIVETCNLPDNEIDGIDKSILILISVFIIKKYMYRNKGNNILEIGCTSGILSYFIGLIINFFGKSKLHCISDLMSNNSESIWLNNMMSLGEMDNISITYTNYNDINLRDSFNDITIINGYDYFEDPEVVVRNAIRMTKKNGLLLCIGKKQPLLCDMFRTIVENCEMFIFDDDNIVFKKLLDDKDKLQIPFDVNADKLKKIKEDFNGLEDKITRIEDLDINDLDNVISVVSKLQKRVLEVYDSIENIDIKFELSELKEALINYRIIKNNSVQNLDSYINRCKDKYFIIQFI